MAEDFEVAPAAEVIVKHRSFKNRTHLLQGLLPVVDNIKAADMNLSPGRPDLAEHHSDGGAFSRAVMAEQAEDFAGGHAQAEVLDGLAFLEEFRDVFELDH